MHSVLRSITILSTVTLFVCTNAAYADMSEARKACKSDAHAFCEGIQPGQGRIAKCMKEHYAQLSPGCQTAIKTIREQRRQAKAAKSGEFNK